MDIISVCALFLIEHIYYWVLFFFIFLAFVVWAIYAYFRLERPEIKNEFTPFEIEMTKCRIFKYLIGDIATAIFFFSLIVLSFVLKIAFMLAWI